MHTRNRKDERKTDWAAGAEKDRARNKAAGKVAGLNTCKSRGTQEGGLRGFWPGA
jgi:hypothetical protein